MGVVWYEELDSFAGMEEVRSVNQSLLRGGSDYWVFCSFNPPKTVDNWVNAEKLIKDEDRLVHHSTYLEVPRKWLGDEFFRAAEKLKKRNEMLYRHEYLGEVTGTGGAVFQNVEAVRLSDKQINMFDRPLYGLDFGFSVDPLAFVACHYNRHHETLYIYDEIYEAGLKNKNAVQMMKRVCGNRRVTADSAEPRTIAEMRDLGLEVSGARKGPDSIEHGIRWLQNLQHIYVDKERCPNTYRELIGYEYAQNKQGQFISGYPDKNNHAIDAIRYATEAIVREPVNVHSARQSWF